MNPNIVPEPKEVIIRHGRLSIPAGGGKIVIVISDERARVPAGLVAKKINMRIVLDDKTRSICIRMNIVKSLDFAHKLRPDKRVEAYRLEACEDGIDISALTSEGLLRGVATLFQLARYEKGTLKAPYVLINDWPNFRYRCGADWLVNVECNRWAYDWGDGRKEFLERIKRKLDFCFNHKLNMVWFDGFGWDTERFPGYAALMKECNQYARRLGIKLEFGGYGGGYGTAYQGGEIYRCGYFGKVYRNQRSYPNGREYDCCGSPSHISRRYGTCPSNERLKSAKLEEMKRFVTEVNPGFMYIHDIDAAGWMAVQATWKERCGKCRKRWPNDELAAADGHAGAYAVWFRQVRKELSALPSCGDYSPARDLVLIFISPLYTHYNEREHGNVWELEKKYFDTLSRLIGPEPGIEFGLREQFYDKGNRKKITGLRESLDTVGHGHGIHVIAFGGGDNYISDDLTNISGAMAHFYDGAESVCLSNGGMHEEPIQMLNAEFLWSGDAGGYRENPADETAAEAVFKKIASSTHKPPEIFSAGGYFGRMCFRLWGKKSGKLMRKALQATYNGQLPVSHVWWSITKTVLALKNDEAYSLANGEKEWTARELATRVALGYARKAANISDNEDIHWFVKCLEVGRRFAEAVKLLILIKSGRGNAAFARLGRVIDELEMHIWANFKLERTDILGGDPGCWLETIAEIRNLCKSFVKLQKKGIIFTDFIIDWLVSRAMPSAGKLENLAYPKNKEKMQFVSRSFTNAFCDLHHDLFACAPHDALVYFAGWLDCAESVDLELRLGYDGPIKVWLDRRQAFHDPDGTNPGKSDAAIVPWKAVKGSHELVVALGSNNGKACGIFVRFSCKSKLQLNYGRIVSWIQTVKPLIAR